MISIIIYRMFFSDGRRPRFLYVLTMTAYYCMCFLLMSGSLSLLTGVEEEELTPVDEVPLSEVTGDELRRRNVTDRWALRSRLLERHCREAGDARPHRPGERGLLISQRHKLISCAGGDTGDHFWLRTFVRLAKDDPTHRCDGPYNDITRCWEDASRLKALTDGDSGTPPVTAEWTHVLTVSHPYTRLAAAYLREPFPAPDSTFPQAVKALISGSTRVPAAARPLTTSCDLCGSGGGRLLLLQAETEEEELAELGRQRGISEYLRRPAPNPHSPAARAAAAGPTAEAVSHLLGQLSPDQLRRLQRLYQPDFDALSFYEPDAFGVSVAPLPADGKRPTRGTVGGVRDNQIL